MQSSGKLSSASFLSNLQNSTVLAKKVTDGHKLAAAKKKKKPTAVVAKKGKKIEKPILKSG